MTPGSAPPPTAPAPPANPHQHYDEYDASHNPTWQSMTPTLPLIDLLNQLIDTRPLEAQFQFCKDFVEYGIVDYMKLHLDVMAQQPNPATLMIESTKDKIKAIETDYHDLAEQIRLSREANHSAAMRAGYGAQTEAGDAFQTDWGVTHNQHPEQQWGFHEAPQAYGQPGYAPQSPFPQQQMPPQYQAPPPPPPTVTQAIGGAVMARFMPPPPQGYTPYQPPPQGYIPPPVQYYY